MLKRNYEQPAGGAIIKELDAQDWIFGAVERPDILPNGDWRPYKPNPEKQATKYFDPFSCVSESVTNAMEELINKMMTEDPNVRLIAEKLQLLDDDGKANLSGRFLAVMSGTIPGQGNSQKAVLECLRKNGVVGEKVWPSNWEMTQDQYFATISQEAKNLGKEFLKYFDPNYEAILDGNDNLEKAAKKGPLVVIVGGAYLGNIAGALLYRNNGTPLYNHQVNYVSQRRNVSDFNQIIARIHDIFDTYDPFDKPYYENYPFKYAKIIYLKKKLFPMIYKKIGQPAMCFKHWSEDALIAFSDGSIPGGDLFKSLFGVEKYSDLPRQDVAEWPYPIKYNLTTTGQLSNLE